MSRLGATDRFDFSEQPAWQEIGTGWRPLQGSFQELGYSVEWHDFSNRRDLDWSRSFHSDGVEIGLNLDGRGEVQAGAAGLELTPQSAAARRRSD